MFGSRLSRTIYYIPGQGNPEVDTFPDTPDLLRRPSNGAQQLHTAILRMVLPS